MCVPRFLAVRDQSLRFGYVPKGKPGQKSSRYIITCTNKILGLALEQLTGEWPVFNRKKTTARRDMTMSARYNIID